MKIQLCFVVQSPSRAQPSRAHELQQATLAIPSPSPEFAQVHVHSIEKTKSCDILTRSSLLSPQLSNNETPFQTALAKKQNIPLFPAPSQRSFFPREHDFSTSSCP